LQDLPWWAIISLPLFFAGGMSLLDTIDGSFMNFAYGWAFSKPVRKVYYNIIITGLICCGCALCRWTRSVPSNCESTEFKWRVLELRLGILISIKLATLSWPPLRLFGRWRLLLWNYGKIEARWHNTAHAAQMARGENTDHAAAGIDLGPITDGWKID
jgi:high-affinity nickel-transport protein